MLVLMPKYSYYTALEDGDIYPINKFIRETITKYMQDTPTVLVEDQLAMEAFPDKIIYTITHDRDVKAIRSYEIFDDYSNTAMDYRNNATVPNYLVNNTYNDIPTMMKDIEKYKKEWANHYYELAKDAVVHMSARFQVCMIFTGKKLSKTKFTPEPAENDGILYILPSLETKTTEFRYSGLWVKEDVANSILGGIYGSR